MYSFLPTRGELRKHQDCRLQANASAQEAHKFAVHLVGTLGNMYEKGIAEGNNMHEVASVMSEQARTICIYLAAKSSTGRKSN